MTEVLNLRRDKKEEEPVRKVEALVLPKDEVRVANVAKEPIKNNVQESIAESSTPNTGKRKYIFGVSLIVFSILIGIFMRDFMFAAVLGIGGLVLLLNINRSSEDSVVADDGGISIGDHYYRYEDLSYFSIAKSSAGLSEIILKPVKWYKPSIRAEVKEEEATRVTNVMLSYIPEKPHENSILDAVSSRLGF